MSNKVKQSELFKKLYVRTRRVIRPLITKNTLLDRLLGDVLRRLERQLRPYEYLISPSANDQIETRGLRLAYRPEDQGVITTLLLNGDYETETVEYILQVLQPGMTFVDLGAHIGYFTLLAAKAVSPNGHVYAFEPAPSTRQILHKNISLNRVDSKVTVVPKAVADKVGLVHFFVSPDSSVSAKISTPSHNKTDLISVQTTSLDSFFMNALWPEIHLIKMDIEGAELATLKGMRELSLRNTNLKLIMEFNYPHIRRLNIQPEQVFDALHACHFSKFFVLRGKKRIFIPQDISTLVKLARRMTVNILCEK